MVVVLRAGGLDALWPAAGQGAHWSSQHGPLVLAGAGVGAAGPAGALPDAAAQPAAAALREAVVAAFAGIQSGLQAGPATAAREGRLPMPPQLVVLLAGPAVGVLTLPWADALLQPDSAQRHARAALLARGYAVHAEDSVQIDLRPARGQPRAVFWVPAWLQREVQALASTLKVRRCSVQALNLVAAAWLARQPNDGRVWGLLGSGALQLWSAGNVGAAGQVLADNPAAAPPRERVQALWQRAGLRTPWLAAARLCVLSLDEAPPSGPSTDAAAQPPASPQGTDVDWLPWPVQDGLYGVTGRAALDLQLMQAALVRPVLPLPVLLAGQAGVSAAEGTGGGSGVGAGAGSVAHFGADARPLWWGAVALALTASVALAWGAMQREAAVRDALAAPAAVAAPRAVAATATAAERGELRAVNAAVQQLNLPLPQLLRALQPPRDIAVRLHALDLAPRGAESGAGPTPNASARTLVKVSAEAPRSRDMTRYVDFLVGRQGMGAVQLVRHEVDSTGAGGDIYRFELELEWPR